MCVCVLVFWNEWIDRCTKTPTYTYIYIQTRLQGEGRDGAGAGGGAGRRGAARKVSVRGKGAARQ